MPLQPSDVFVDREVALASLLGLVKRAADQHGSVIFVAGDTGMGKGALIRTLESRAAQLPPPVKAEFAHGHCYADLGTTSPYQPFVEILGTLVKPERDVRQLAIKVLENIPDLLDVIPGIGPIAKVAVKSGAAAAQWLVDPAQKSELTTVLANKFVDAVVQISANHSPLVLIVEDTQWIDGPTCLVLRRLLEECAALPLVLIVTYRPSQVSRDSVFDQVLSDTKAENLAQVITLNPLDQNAVEAYLRAKYGTEFGSNVAAWLLHVCGGNPLFTTQFIAVLEEQEIIHRDADGQFVFEGDISDAFALRGSLALLPIPTSIEEVLDQRIRHIVEDDIQTLEAGSVQGQLFLSSILQRVLNVQEIALLSQLSRIAHEDRVITAAQPISWDKTSDVYSFDTLLLQQAFYKRLSPRLSEIYHSGVADALDALVKAAERPSRMLVLQTAIQCERGGRPLQAAKYYLQAAQSTFDEGALAETRELCERSLAQVRALPAAGPPDQHFLHGDVIRLLLLVTRIQWRGRPDLQGDLPLEQLVAEGIAEADAANDTRLQAQIKYLQGVILLVSASLGQSLVALKEAIELARAANDAVGEFTIMAEYGHHLVGEKLQDGLLALQQALDVYKSKVLPLYPDELPVVVEVNALKLKGFLGVGYFDAGDFDSARRFLEESVSGLERLKRDAELPLFYSFLGQLNTATGAYESADDVYTRALDCLKTSHGPNAWRGYHLSLRGKLFIEWSRTADATGPMLQAWDETQRSWQVDLVPLVRNYLAEFLMQGGLLSTDLTRADQLLFTTITETKESGFHRSEIAALSLRGRLALMTGHVQDAISYSTEAVTKLEQLGTMPALRTEEVWFVHYAIMLSAGREAEAAEFLARARFVVESKSQSVADDQDRHRFRERVRLSRAILSGDASLIVEPVVPSPVVPPEVH